MNTYALIPFGSAGTSLVRIDAEPPGDRAYVVKVKPDGTPRCKHASRVEPDKILARFHGLPSARDLRRARKEVMSDEARMNRVIDAVVQEHKPPAPPDEWNVSEARAIYDALPEPDKELFEDFDEFVLRCLFRVMGCS